VAAVGIGGGAVPAVDICEAARGLAEHVGRGREREGGGW